MRSRCAVGGMLRGGELSEVHRTRIWTGKVWESGGRAGGAVEEDGRNVMQTAAAKVVTDRHNHKTDVSGNPI